MGEGGEEDLGLYSALSCPDLSSFQTNSGLNLQIFFLSLVPKSRWSSKNRV